MGERDRAQSLFVLLAQHASTQFSSQFASIPNDQFPRLGDRRKAESIWVEIEAADLPSPCHQGQELLSGRDIPDADHILDSGSQS